MTDLDIKKNIGNQIDGKILCPECGNEFGQKLNTIGDRENELICGHCELQIEIKLVYRPVELKLIRYYTDLIRRIP